MLDVGCWRRKRETNPREKGGEKKEEREEDSAIESALLSNPQHFLYRSSIW
jgi:hypothetical protein